MAAICAECGTDREGSMPIARIAALSAAIPKERVDIMDLGFDADTAKRTMRLTGVHAVRYAP